MKEHPIYRYTSMGRALDPAYATNRLVLLAMPLAGLLAALAAGIRGAGLVDITVAGVVGAVVAFGAWALARELAPDDNPSAFVSLAFALAAYLAMGAPSLLLLFTALLLVRIVNRTVGLPARATDSLVVAAGTLATMYVTQSPLLAVIGALAFALDAALPRPLHRQWAFAGLCIVGIAVWVWQRGMGTGLAMPAGTAAWIVAIISAGYALALLRTRDVASVDDASGQRLSLARVRAGMLTGFMVAAQGLLLGTPGVRMASAVWAALAGVALGSLLGFPRAGQEGS